MNKLQEFNSKLSNQTGFTEEQISTIKNTIAIGTSNTEFALFLFTAKSLGLNPLNKEIWCYKDHKGNMISFAGRDGFLVKAQGDIKYSGIRSSEVREKDVFSLDIANNKIKHEKEFKDPGRIIGAYAIAFRKEGEPTIEWVDFDTYNKNHSAWKSHPADMIKKVAETHALKKAFGIAGLQSEYDYSIDGDKAYPIDTDELVDLNTMGKIERLIETSTFDSEDRERMRSELGTIGNAKAEEMIVLLKNNQLEPMNTGGYNQGDINKMLDKKMKNEKA